MCKRDWCRVTAPMLLILLALIIVIPNNIAIATNKRVGIALDWHEVQGIAQAAGVSSKDLLEKLRPMGARYLIVREDTLRRLKQVGQIQVLTGWELYQLVKIFGPESLNGRPIVDVQAFNLQDTYVLTTDEHLFGRLMKRLPDRLPGKVYPISDLVLPGNYAIGVQGRWEELERIGIGVSSADVEQVAAFNCEPILGWVDGLKTTAELQQDLSDVAKIGPLMLLPGPTSLESAAYIGAALAKADVLHGVPEFEPVHEGNLIAKASGYQTVRVYERPVHTIYQEYLLAVRDRNVRLVVPHLLWQIPPAQVGTSLVDVNCRHINSVVDAIRAAGGDLGSPQSFAIGSGNRWWLASIVSLLTLVPVGPRKYGFSGWFQWGLAACLAIITLILPAGAIVRWRKMWALLVAGIVPAATVIWAEQESKKEAKHLSPLLLSLNIFIKCSSYTILGALVIQALLGEAAFLLKLDAFAGIKVAYVAALGLVLIKMYGSQWAGDSWWKRKQIAPVELAAIGLLSATLWVLFNRSGNSSVIPIPTWELSARSFLESTLFVRPRTKEFLMGHPALLLGLAGFGKGKSYRPYILALGTVGQASMMNTFVHLHTPFVISLIRSLLGIGMGILAGAALWPIGHFIAGRGKKYA